jgi:tetratricopeptide (TPR) repeat protein
MPASPAVSISACLIVRDEAALLDACLRSLAGVDELIVVDTGSTDATVAIAAAHGATVAHAEWRADFAAARNVSLAVATGDWILVVDADQRLIGGIDAVRETIRQHGNDGTVLCPVIRNLDADGQPATAYRSGQAFRRRPGRRYVGRIHERISDDGQPLSPVWVEGWHLDHVGFTAAMRHDRDKVARNLALLDRWVAEHPDDADGWYYLGAELQMAGRLTEARTAYESGLAALPGTVATSLLRLNLLGVLESLGEWPAVLERANRWQADGDHYPDFWLIAGRAALRAGQRAKAEDGFRAAAAFADSRPVAFETVGARSWKPAAYQALVAAEAGAWQAVRQLLAPWRAETSQDAFLMRLSLHAACQVDPAAALAALPAHLAAVRSVAVADAVDEVLGHFPAIRQAVSPLLPSLPAGRWLLARQCQRDGDWTGLLGWVADGGLSPAGTALLTGVALAGLGRHAEAQAPFATACRLAPDLAEAWTHRAAAAAQDGDGAAWGHWRQALAAGASPLPVLEAMARHALATANVARAEPVARQLRQLDPLHPLLWPLGDLLQRL